MVAYLIKKNILRLNSSIFQQPDILRKRWLLYDGIRVQKLMKL
jgi:hypothetical protein